MSEKCFCNDFIGGVCYHCYVGKVDELKIANKALADIKKHIEISSPTGYKMSAAWNIANKCQVVQG